MKKVKTYLPIMVFLLLATATVYPILQFSIDSVPTVARPQRFDHTTLVIDAGHGGEDGGAVSPAGTIESAVNLAIATRLDAILGLFGADVRMLRTENISLHDSNASTLRQKKVSDLHNRVSVIEETPNATLISIHQNSYTGSTKYHGAQVFYANADQSLHFAQCTQEILRKALDPNNSRQAALMPESIYLLKNVTCRAILVECGFLTNSKEDALLQTGEYQTKIAAALASAYLDYKESMTIVEEPSNES